MPYKSRMFAVYDRICPICNTPFHNRDLRVKYCSKRCVYESVKIRNKEYACRYRKKNNTQPIIKDIKVNIQ